MSSGRSVYSGLLIAGAVVLVVVVASIALRQKKQTVQMRQETERVERVDREEREAAEEARAKRDAEREQAARQEQVSAKQEREEVEQEALVLAEKQRLAAQAEGYREERRRKAGEQARKDAERRLADQEPLDAAREKERERTEEEAKRKEDAKKEAAEERVRAQAGKASADAVGDDTADVDTETSIDDISAGRGWSLKGDLRPILNYADEGNGDEGTTDDLAAGARARLEATWGINDWLRAAARFAGTCFTENCDLELVLDSSSDNGLSGGQFTLDELFIHSFRKERFDVALGRLQTRFVLRGGVYAKSLDRNDSNNVNVTWTDGVQATYRGSQGWSHHFVLQRNARDGSGSIRHGPLDFNDSSARNTYFVGFENIQSWRSVVQRAFDVSYLPGSLLKDGDPDGRRVDYWGLVGRLAGRWPQRTEGLRLRAGVELGYATETPTGEAVGLAGSGDVDGFAWNVVVSAMDIAPGHSVGLNYGRVSPGWFLSPQFRPNEELIEIRYQWRSARWPLLEARVRRREDLEPLVTAARTTSALDAYVRLTWRFSIKEF